MATKTPCRTARKMTISQTQGAVRHYLSSPAASQVRNLRR